MSYLWIFGPHKFGTKIITIAGKNKGAIMELGASRKKGNPNEAERSNINGETHKRMEMQPPPTTVFINTNM